MTVQQNFIFASYLSQPVSLEIFEKPSEKVPENVCFRVRRATRSQLVTPGIGDLILGKLPLGH